MVILQQPTNGANSVTTGKRLSYLLFRRASAAPIVKSGRSWHRLVLKTLYYLVFILTVGAVSLYMWDCRSSLEIALHVPLYLWLIPTFIYLVMLAAKGLSFDILVRVHKINVPFLDSIGLTAVGVLSNYLVPGNMTLPLRTLYMHRVQGLNYKLFLPIVLSAFVFSIGLYGIFAGIASLLQKTIPSANYGLVILVFSGSGIILVVGMLLPFRRLPLLGGHIESMLTGWRALVRSRKLFSQWICMEVLRAALEIALVYSIFWLLAIELTFWQTAVIVLVKECSVLLRITPGAFGIAEGVQAFFAMQFGADVASILLAAIIGRVIELSCLGLVSLALVPRLARSIRESTPIHSVKVP